MDNSDNWSVEYSTRSVLGVGAHGIISVRNASGDIVHSYEGLSYGPDGEFKPMGTSVHDTIRAQSIKGVSNNFGPTSPSDVLFSGPREEVMSMMAAAELAVTAINARDIGYPPFAVLSTPRSIGISNSNAVIETLAVVMGLQPPLSITLPIPGQGVLLLDVETILSIRAATWDRPGSSLQPHCFLADTPVEMADGTEKPIQDIVAGDQVMAFDPKANNGMGAKRPARVRRTFRNTARQIVDLRGLRMTPGHVVLSDNGEWLKIVEVLRRDRAIVEERKTGPVLVRARTGAVLGSDEDAPVTVLFTDRDGLPHKAVVRAGIVCTAQRQADGTYQGWSLARVLRHQSYTIEQDGTLIAADGRRFNATPWPGGTPLDAAFQHDWVICVDDVPFTPAWIAELRDEDERAIAVNETPVPFPIAPPTGPAGLNRKERRRLAALRVVK